MDPALLELLGLPEDATMADVLAAIEALLTMVAEGAADAGADATADAVDEAADAVAEAEGAAEDDQDAIDAAAAETTAASVVVALSKEVRRLHARLDVTDRTTLMSGRAFTPGIRKWLMSQPLAVVRSYVATIPRKTEPRAPKTPDGVADTELSAEDLQLCSITGMDPAEMVKQRKLEKAGRKPVLQSKRMPINNGRVS